MKHLVNAFTELGCERLESPPPPPQVVPVIGFKTCMLKLTLKNLIVRKSKQENIKLDNKRKKNELAPARDILQDMKTSQVSYQGRNPNSCGLM